jgi:hypothetical protein
LCGGAFSGRIVTELIAMRLATPPAALKMLTALACFACACAPNSPNPRVSATGQEPRSQAEATLALAADAAAAGSRTYTFRAELVGGRDNDQRFYCAASTWAYGDGPAMTSTPSCTPWTPDSTIPRQFTSTHAYMAPGRYVVSFTYGPLSAQRTLDVE